jgi:hypothetical protein
MALPPSDPEAILRQGWKVVSTQWLIQVAVVIAAGVGLPLLWSGPAAAAERSRFLTWIFLAAGVADLALGWWFRARVLPTRLRAAGSAAEAAGIVTGMSLLIVSLAITPAVFGVALYVIGDRQGLAWLCAVSLVAHWLFRPRYEDWQVMIRRLGR